jgi:hypothetical protein
VERIFICSREGISSALFNGPVTGYDEDSSRERRCKYNLRIRGFLVIGPSGFILSSLCFYSAFLFCKVERIIKILSSV